MDQFTYGVVQTRLDGPCGDAEHLSDRPHIHVSRLHEAQCCPLLCWEGINPTPDEATLFSLFQTLALWNLNPRLWLQAYLAGCAQAGGQAPADVSSYLPWNMKAQQREAWRMFDEEPSQEGSHQDTS